MAARTTVMGTPESGRDEVCTSDANGSTYVVENGPSGAVPIHRERAPAGDRHLALQGVPADDARVGDGDLDRRAHRRREREATPVNPSPGNGQRDAGRWVADAAGHHALVHAQ